MSQPSGKLLEIYHVPMTTVNQSLCLSRVCVCERQTHTHTENITTLRNLRYSTNLLWKLDYTLELKDIKDYHSVHQVWASSIPQTRKPEWVGRSQEEQQDFKWETRVVPPYPWGLCSKTSSRFLKPQINPIYTVFPIHTYLWQNLTYKLGT